MCYDDLPSAELWPVNLQNFTGKKSKFKKWILWWPVLAACLSSQLAGDESLKFKCNKANMADRKASPLCPPITWERHHKSQNWNVQTLWVKASLSNSTARLLPVILVMLFHTSSTFYLKFHYGMWKLFFLVFCGKSAPLTASQTTFHIHGFNSNQLLQSANNTILKSYTLSRNSPNTKPICCILPIFMIRVTSAIKLFILPVLVIVVIAG